MRLDHFLPFSKRPRPERERVPHRRFRTFAARFLPASFFSKLPPKTRPVPGLLRRTLTALGPTWASAPLRRVVQVLCFLAFLWLFFYVCWPYGHQDLAADMAQRALIPPASFLAIDPLVSLSTALAAKAWVWSLIWAAGILLACVLFPRGFCGYICPLGTLIDLFDWAIGKRTERFRVKRDGWWMNLKYYLLVAVLVSSLCGVLISGFVAAIPVITRGFLFVLAPLQLGGMRGFYQVPAFNVGQWISIALFLAVLALGLLRKRFWCRYVCPSGALFSLGNFFRVTERKVEDSCIKCGKCVEICPFDAIKADFTTRIPDCTLCQTCGGVCPTHAIKFVDRFDVSHLKKENDPPTHEIPVTRRGLLVGLAGGAAAAVTTGLPFLSSASAAPVIRPPGSVPESQFLELCIRCGECFKACPNNVLQPMGLSTGLANLWTPEAVPNWSGCEPSCNNCGQVCPTGAIRALPMAEKRVARMGLALVNEQTCLPHAGQEACQLCVDECNAAGYQAIEFRLVHSTLDAQGQPVDGTGFLAPVVNASLCVGCGLCQTRCSNVNVKSKHLLTESAIIVHAGDGLEDRVSSGSYLQLRADREKAASKPGKDTPYSVDF
ncbi:hypothetical protein BH09VER1_BH09VER1_45740 [soil metagenome]